MSVCERRYAATQFALLSAVYALSRWAVGPGVGSARGAARIRPLLPAHLRARTAGVRPAALGAQRGLEPEEGLSYVSRRGATGPRPPASAAGGARPAAPAHRREARTAAAGVRRARSDRHRRAVGERFPARRRRIPSAPSTPAARRRRAPRASRRRSGPPARRPAPGASSRSGPAGRDRRDRRPRRPDRPAPRAAAPSPRTIPCSSSASASASAESNGPRATGARRARGAPRMRARTGASASARRSRGSAPLSSACSSASLHPARILGIEQQIHAGTHGLHRGIRLAPPLQRAVHDQRIGHDQPVEAQRPRSSSRIGFESVAGSPDGSSAG